MARDRKQLSTLPHQKKGTSFLRSRDAAALFDEQGLGKTKQLIDAIVGDISSSDLEGALIVCPNILKSTWGQEIERHSAGYRYAVFGAGRSARREAFRSLTASFYIINYEAVAAELPSLRALLEFKKMALVLDESHRIKTPTAKVTQSIHRLRQWATKRYIMTGTPVANKPEDLWSQLYFLDDGQALGASFDSFRSRYCSSAGGYVRLDDLREKIAHLSLRRQKEGTVKLPRKTYIRALVDLSGRQLALYAKMRDDLAIEVRSMSGEQITKHADAILARLVRLSQLSSNPGLIDYSFRETPAKFLALDELLSTYLSTPNEKAIVWTSFVGNVRELIARYRTYKPVGLHGEMDSKARDRSVRAFKTDPNVRLLVANPAAAREGLTLTEARVAIYLDRTFNLVDYLQSQDRIHRLSQTQPCEIVLLVGRNTIDEFIDFSLEQKHRLAKYTQGDSKEVAASDLALTKPGILRALLVPSSRNARRQP